MKETHLPALLSMDRTIVLLRLHTIIDARTIKINIASVSLICLITPFMHIRLCDLSLK